MAFKKNLQILVIFLEYYKKCDQTNQFFTVKKKWKMPKLKDSNATF